MNAKPDAMTAQSSQELLEHLRALVTEAETILGDQSPSQHSEARLEALRERYEAAQERLAEFYRRTKSRVAEGARQTDRTIRAHPYEAMAVALGIGLLAGLLLGRRPLQGHRQ